MVLLEVMLGKSMLPKTLFFRRLHTINRRVLKLDMILLNGRKTDVTNAIPLVFLIFIGAGDYPSYPLSSIKTLQVQLLAEIVDMPCIQLKYRC